MVVIEVGGYLANVCLVSPGKLTMYSFQGASARVVHDWWALQDGVAECY
jgi:hypothetical protein